MIESPTVTPKAVPHADIPDILEIDICNDEKIIYSGHLMYGGKNAAGDEISFTNYYMQFNGKPYFAIMGEFQFSKVAFESWEEELLKMKASGIKIICTYIFWIHHEEDEGVFDWSGNRNLALFVEICKKLDFYVMLRIGPFVHGECRNGGFPDWLYGRPFKLRSNDEEYLCFVDRLYREIQKQVSGEMFKDNGPVIGIQVENELDHSGAPWEVNARCGDTRVERGVGGDEGKLHLRKLKQLAIDAGMDVPLFTSTGWGGAPIVENEILPMYGGYAFQPWVMKGRDIHPPTSHFIFKDYHSENTTDEFFDPPYPAHSVPFACCELGTGMQVWYSFRFTVPAICVESMALQKIAGGCNILGYFVFHGGLQPHGKHGFTNEYQCPKIAYDFQAPIRDFGQLTDSYRGLKLLHYFLNDLGESLAPMRTFLPENCCNEPSDTQTVRWAVRAQNGRGFLFINNHQDHVTAHEHRNVAFKFIAKNEALQIPMRGGLTIAKDTCSILPFNMELDGTVLKYATAQYMRKLTDRETEHYFFFEPQGMRAEFCFDSESLSEPDVQQGCAEQLGNRVVIRASADQCNSISFLSANNHRVQIHTLSRDQALNFWVANLFGKERVIISKSTLIISDTAISCTSIGNEIIEVGIFPPLGADLKTSVGDIKGELRGMFEHFSIRLRRVEVPMEIQIKNDINAVINFPRKLFPELNDIFLNIDYCGDVGHAFIDGRLIHDNFFNGTTWQIGLKQFMPNVFDKGMYLYILPLVRKQLRQGKIALNRIVFELPENFDNRLIEEEISKIISITAVPEYRVEISTAQHD